MPGSPGLLEPPSSDPHWYLHLIYSMQLTCSCLSLGLISVHMSEYGIRALGLEVRQEMLPAHWLALHQIGR